MHRKDRVYEALRSLCAQKPAQSSILRHHGGFSAEEVAEQAKIDRTNASRDLNLLTQEGIIERIPGRPVLFTIRTTAEHKQATVANTPQPVVTKSEIPPIVSKKTTELSPIVNISPKVKDAVSDFETLIGKEGGLHVAIQQAKAAIIYPPRGLHTLLCGPSGVGKTTLARLMHAFALELKALPDDAPFISFNCADYAGNPQLLMAHLFGVVKGAYTGADRDREGLVEQANRGILFLDEVHRLPPEGQEMLFYLMDRERFRRLGEARERHASLLLLAATTEDPNVALLPTFRRRIPMTINLPGIHERTISERYELIRAFFSAECSSIGTNIHVAPQVLRAFLLYECPGNIGQLRSDVQLTCARAYLEFRTQSQADMHVHLDVLPEHVRRGLLRTADLHRTLDPVASELEAAHIFTPSGLNLNSYPGSTHDLYENINTELAALKNSNLKLEEINELLHLDIQHYFQSFADTVVLDEERQPHFVEPAIEAVSSRIVQIAQEQLGRDFPDKLNLILALHLSSALEHIQQNRPLIEPSLQSLHHTYPKEYAVAQTALLHIRSQLGIALPESETNMLTILLANADMLLSTERATVGIVVAAHGRGIAAGLADLANTLVGTTNVLAVELTLEQSPSELLTKVEQSVKRTDQGSGVLLLVDFTSLLSLGELVTQHTGIQTRTVSGASAPLLVEALRKAQGTKHATVEQLATYLSHFRPIAVQEHSSGKLADQEQSAYAMASEEAKDQVAQKRVILSVCLTGFGSATKMAELIEDRLPELDKQGVEIICVDINLSGKTEADIQRLVGNQQVVAIAGTINPHLDSYPFISLTDLLFGDGITRLRTLLGGTLIDPAAIQPGSIHTVAKASIDEAPTFTRRADLLREVSATLSQRLLFLNPARVLPLIESMIELIEVEVGETFEIEVLAGLVLHLACVLDRGTQQRTFQVNDHIRTSVERQFARELSICRHAWQILSTQIGRPLPDEEAYNIVSILRQVDIFMLNAS